MQIQLGQIKTGKDSLGNNYEFLEPKLNARIEQPADLKLSNIYPYADKLERDANFESVNYQVANMLGLVKRQEQTHKDTVDGGFTYSIDLAYQVEYTGFTQAQIHKLDKVPVLRKLTATKKEHKDLDAQSCLDYYDGHFLESTQTCVFYQQARKICLVIDQDSPDFAPVANYRSFPCNQQQMNNKENIRWTYLRWFAPGPNRRDPNLYDMTVSELEFEIYLSNEPSVQVLRHMDVTNFALESASYRLEAIVMFALAFASLTCAIVVNMAKKESTYASLTENQEQELSRIDEENPAIKKLSERRKKLSMVKKINKKMVREMKTKRKELTRIYIRDLTEHYDNAVKKDKLRRKAQLLRD